MAVVGYFPATLLVDPETFLPIRDTEAQVYAATDTSFSAPLQITDIAGIPLAGNKLVSNRGGIVSEFRVPAGIAQVIVKSGQALTPITSIGVYADAAEQSASGAVEAAGVAEKAAETAEAAAKIAVEAAAGAGSGSSFGDIAVTYDAAGNVSSVKESGVTTTFTYNANGTVSTDTRLGKTRTYAYDLAGNLINITVVGGGPVTPDPTDPTDPTEPTDPTAPAGGFDNGFDTGF